MSGPNTDNMSQDELDLWSDINNPNNDASMDDWGRRPQSKQRQLPWG